PTEATLRLSGALLRFWETHGHLSEGREWYQMALTQEQGAGGRTKTRAKVLNGAGVLAYRQGEYAVARACYEESLAIGREIRDWQSITAPLNNLGIVAYEQGDYLSARAYLAESLAMDREAEDNAGIASSLNNLGE